MGTSIGTYVVGGILLVIIGLAIRQIRKDKGGCSACGHSCGSKKCH